MANPSVESASTIRWNAIAARLRKDHPHLMMPDGRYFWPDLLICAPLGWLLFATAISVGIASPIAYVGLTFISAMLLLRVAYMVHEISHFGPHELHLFVAVWHLVIGLPILIPSMMVDPHTDHHRNDTYGTQLDPEYEPVATYGRLRLVLSVFVLIVVPPLLVLRFALAPITWLLPPLRRLTIERLSTLGTNAAYIRRMPHKHERPRIMLQEALASVVAWGLVGLALSGHHNIVIQWWVTIAVALGVNQVRTHVAHVYELDPLGTHRAHDLEEQMTDTITIGGSVLLTEWFGPVGTRYHALHHLLPTVPYHHLRTVHELLLKELPKQNAYHRNIKSGALMSLAELWARAKWPLHHRNRTLEGRRSEA